MLAILGAALLGMSATVPLDFCVRLLNTEPGQQREVIGALLEGPFDRTTPGFAEAVEGARRLSLDKVPQEAPAQRLHDGTLARPGDGRWNVREGNGGRMSHER